MQLVDSYVTTVTLKFYGILCYQKIVTVCKSNVKYSGHYHTLCTVTSSTNLKCFLAELCALTCLDWLQLFWPILTIISNIKFSDVNHISHFKTSLESNTLTVNKSTAGSMNLQEQLNPLKCQLINFIPWIHNFNIKIYLSEKIFSSFENYPHE